WVRLWKLHGSIGWMMRPNGQVTRVPECDTSNMVYPSHIKYSQTQAAPFSALFERLKNFIMEPDSLLITTGFSFADAHISSKISECLSAN
ncbi:SIR2 family protein, partial [Enterococcus faecium]|uniref:SIR2 family protein n=1 Tax=Enterococcus faecium TaxID=1352 RepID=UPI003F52350A